MRCYEFDLNRTIKIEFLDKGRLTQPHMHVSRRLGTYIMYVVTKGEILLKNDEQEIVLCAGDVCVFEKGELQMPVTSTECEYYYIHFNGDNVMPIECTKEEYYLRVRQSRESFINSDARGFDRFNYLVAFVMKITHIEDKVVFDRIISELERCRVPVGNGSIRRRFRAATMVMEIILEMQECACEAIVCNNRINNNTYKAVSQIREYIDHNFCDNIDRREIESRFSFQYDYANRIFKKYTGQSIISYRNSKRIEAARFLLSTTDKNINTVAKECGFNDQYYFVKYFKKFNGCSPMQYRSIENGSVLF